MSYYVIVIFISQTYLTLITVEKYDYVIEQSTYL